MLRGDLILVASGDLTMGGRTNPDGSIALGNLDHNEANSLGNADLTRPDPLAGYRALARRVCAVGIRRVTGDVVVDDRLFRPYLFRDEFEVRPIFVNDDVVDVAITPTKAGEAAAVKVRRGRRPCGYTSIRTGGRGSSLALSVDPELPRCIGRPGLLGDRGRFRAGRPRPALDGDVPAGPDGPRRGARELRAHRTRRAAPRERGQGRRQRGRAQPRHPPAAPRRYPAAAKVAELTGLPYADDAKFVMKVSYNIGADTSLLLFGLTQGVDNMDAALAKERHILASRYGIPPAEYSFLDGSGGGETQR